MFHRLGISWDLPTQVALSAGLAERLKEDLVSRFTIAILVGGLVVWSGLPVYALVWFAFIICNEVFEPIFVRRLCNPALSDLQRLVPFTIHMVIGTLIWSVLGVVLMLSNDPGLMVFGLAILIGILVHSTSLYTECLTNLFATAVPAGLSLLVAAVVPFWTGDRALNQNVTIAAAVILLMIYFFIAAFTNHKAQMALHAANRRAEAANAAKSAFLANMSHEIRTPMNGVVGMAHALQSTTLNEQQQEMVETIISSGGTLTGLLNDVLDISKVEAGKVEIVSQETDIQQLVTDLVRLFQPEAQKKAISLTVHAQSTVPDLILCDQLRVRQCVANLVSNAIKFTSNGGVEVDIAAEASRNHDGTIQITIDVRDTGIGISDRQLQQLFQPFNQADASTTRRFGGTGLGLALSRKLARLMKGDLTVVSTPGVGSTFSLRFNITEAVSVTDPQECLPQPSVQELPITQLGPRPTLLLVDDHEINRKVIRALLKDAPIDIVEAPDGQTALEQLNGQAFDLVLLDVHMPVMDGVETVRRLRNMPSPIRELAVIAVTADAMPGDRERLIAAGMTDYLAKPVQPQKLRELIQHYLQNSEHPGLTITA